MNLKNLRLFWIYFGLGVAVFVLAWQLFAQFYLWAGVFDLGDGVSLSVEEVAGYNRFVIMAYYLPCIAYLCVILLSSFRLMRGYVHGKVDFVKAGIVTVAVGLSGFCYSFFVFTGG